ncbi:hypothetical protein AWN90_01805 [Nocardia terpenica]|uniref:Uncharacterized protein n=1 Tax=Nocardia terpenica TaxID=455432 RepID=A0A164KL70_9NOCA|nr:hypothetical protein AWN90_01805 [Nocardia terpenica]
MALGNAVGDIFRLLTDLLHTVVPTTLKTVGRIVQDLRSDITVAVLLHSIQSIIEHLLRATQQLHHSAQNLDIHPEKASQVRILSFCVCSDDPTSRRKEPRSN